MLKYFPIIFIAVLFSCGYNQKPLYQASPLVKILLTAGTEITLKPSPNFVLSVNGKRDMGEGALHIKMGSSGIMLNDMEFPSQSLEIAPGDFFEFQGRKYRGNALIIATNKSLYLINLTDIETYLSGVLPNEVSKSWSKEALKAQAVVSRTYALFEVVNNRRTGRIFDLYSDTRSQVYEGIEADSKETDDAISATSGEVLRYQGKIIQSFFHAASGGMTESSKEAFGDEKPYLVPVDSPFSGVYKENRWEIILPLDDVGRRIGFQDKIAQVSVSERTASKRIKTIELKGVNGAITNISGKDLRNIAGGYLMKSTRANIRLTNESLLVSGVGYGHGVGMGQWDAQGMALQGYDYVKIVLFFYPGTSVDRVW